MNQVTDPRGDPLFRMLKAIYPQYRDDTILDMLGDRRDRERFQAGADAYVGAHEPATSAVPGDAVEAARSELYIWLRRNRFHVSNFDIPHAAVETALAAADRARGGSYVEWRRPEDIVRKPGRWIMVTPLPCDDRVTSVRSHWTADPWPRGVIAWAEMPTPPNWTPTSDDPLTGDLGSTAEAGRKAPEWTAEKEVAVHGALISLLRDACHSGLGHQRVAILEMCGNRLDAAFAPAPEPAWPPGDCARQEDCKINHVCVETLRGGVAERCPHARRAETEGSGNGQH
jgi:hypothetical protein